MSTISLKNVKLGNDIDPSKNFVISVPAVADGTQMCTRSVGFAAVPTNSIAEVVVQWPASFVGSAYAVGTLGPLSASSDVFGVTSIRDLTATSGRVTVRNGAVAAQGMDASCVIFGRWY